MLLDHILKWVYMEYSKLGFGIVIERYGYDKRHMFVTMRCERSGKYNKPIWILKCDEIGTRKYGCHFKLRWNKKCLDV